MSKLFQSISKHKHYTGSFRIHQFISTRFFSELNPPLSKPSDGRDPHFPVDTAAKKVNDNETLDRKPQKKKTKLLNISPSRAREIRKIASFVIGFHEIATVTLTRDMVITSWDSVEIPKTNKKSDDRLSQYNRAVHGAVSQIPNCQDIDLFVIENRYWRASGPVRTSHFLIIKSMLHCLLSQGAIADSKIAYAQWLKTGKILDIAINSSTRKSGKGKVDEIFCDGWWDDRRIIPEGKLAFWTDQGVKVKKYTDENTFQYRPITEEMADALLQAFAFWSTL